MMETRGRHIICRLAAIVLLIAAAGCAGTTPDDGADDTSVAKDQVRKKQNSEGKGDRAVDYCARYDYYGDGTCDGWCPETDPDCGNSPDSCQSTVDCGSGEYCAKDGQDACTSSATGTCKETPQFCTEQYDPVCGCDGNTYGNACKAKSAGVNVAHDGECSTSPSGCQSDDDCGSGEYCAKDGQDACTSSATGTCKQTPQFCTEQYDPVCGCDGNTYGNACKAKSAGVNVAHDGECSTSSSCQSNADCGSGEYCAKDGQDACTPSATGTCKDKPQYCVELYEPVCGCDGNTYGNACKAQSAGMNVASEGTCSE